MLKLKLCFKYTILSTTIIEMTKTSFVDKTQGQCDDQSFKSLSQTCVDFENHFALLERIHT